MRVCKSFINCDLQVSYPVFQKNNSWFIKKRAYFCFVRNTTFYFWVSDLYFTHCRCWVSHHVCVFRIRHISHTVPGTAVFRSRLRGPAPLPRLPGPDNRFTLIIPQTMHDSCTHEYGHKVMSPFCISNSAQSKKRITLGWPFANSVIRLSRTHVPAGQAHCPQDLYHL